MPTVNQALFDATVKHQIYLQRLSGGTVKQILETLIDSETGIMQVLLRDDLSEFSQRRLKAILMELRKLNEDAYNVLQGNFITHLEDLANYESDFTARLVEKALPIEITIVRPAIELLAAIITTKPLAGSFIVDEVKDLESERIDQIEKALRIGLLEGETTPEIVRRIRGSRELQYKDGILQRSRNDIERLVRTAITHVASRARDELYRANESVVKQWRFVATLDRRTTVICASLDGQTFDLDSGPMPPRHSNCRSTTTPILKSWQELGLTLDETLPSTRASMDGAVPENMTYQEWLKKQPQDVIEEVLGKTKAKIFMEDGLPLDRFVDFTGKTYTLDELRARENLHF